MINTLEEWNNNKNKYKTKEDELSNTYKIDQDSVSEEFLKDMKEYSITLSFKEIEGLNFVKTREEYIRTVEKCLDQEEGCFYELNFDKIFNSFLKSELKKFSKYIRSTHSKKERKDVSCSINVENSIIRYKELVENKKAVA